MAQHTPEDATRYEHLLRALAAELAEHGLPPSGRTRYDTALNELDDRLVGLQADLLHARPTLGVSQPKLSAAPPQTPPVHARQAIDRAHRHIDTAGAALDQALRWATMPRFLPQARPKTRHLAVYLICAIVAVIVHAVVILQAGVGAAALGFAIAPAAAFLAGYVIIGHAGRPRIRGGRKRPRLNRYPKPGLIICVVVDLLAAVAWLAA